MFCFSGTKARKILCFLSMLSECERMPEFSAALTTWFDQHPDVTVRGFAREAGLASSLVSGIKSGSPPTFETISKVLPTVSRLSSLSEARALLVAYLRDETPTDYKKHVRILHVDERSGEVDQSDPISQEAIRWERQARQDPEFARMWLTQGGYMFEADSAAVEERVRQFEAEQAASLGLHQSGGAMRTPIQVLAGYDRHTLSERSGLSVAEIERLLSGRDEFTTATFAKLVPALTQPDTHAIEAWFTRIPHHGGYHGHDLPPLEPQATPANVTKLPRAAEDSPSYGAAE
jgi:transcriptional regulator with XRE-family HTH domain/DNA-binding phage protein